MKTVVVSAACPMKLAAQESSIRVTIVHQSGALAIMHFICNAS